METNSPPPEAMWSVSQIAERDNVSKPTVSTHIARLIERHGLHHTRDARGRVAAVDVVQYDALRLQFGDAVRSQAPRGGELPLAGSAGDGASGANTGGGGRNTSLDEATRRKTWLDAHKRQLEVSELAGKLTRTDKIAGAVQACADTLARIVDRLPQGADALARALDLDNVHGCRLALKGIAAQLRTDMADALDALAAEAPATDEPLAEEADEVM